MLRKEIKEMTCAKVNLPIDSTFLTSLAPVLLILTMKYLIPMVFIYKGVVFETLT